MKAALAIIALVVALTIAAGWGDGSNGDKWSNHSESLERQIDSRLDASREQLREVREEIHGDAAIPEATSATDPWLPSSERAFSRGCTIEGCGCMLRALETEYPGDLGAIDAPTTTSAMVRIAAKYGCSA